MTVDFNTANLCSGRFFPSDLSRSSVEDIEFGIELLLLPHARNASKH